MERVSRPKSYGLKGKEQRVGESNLKLAKWPGEEVSSGFFSTGLVLGLGSRLFHLRPLSFLRLRCRQSHDIIPVSAPIFHSPRSFL